MFVFTLNMSWLPVSTASFLMDSTEVTRFDSGYVGSQCVAQQRSGRSAETDPDSLNTSSARNGKRI